MIWIRTAYIVQSCFFFTNTYFQNSLMGEVVFPLLTATRSGISTGREGPVAPVPEPVLPFRN